MSDFTRNLLCGLGFHKWGKWETFIEEGTVVYSDTMKSASYREEIQRKECLICGYKYKEKVGK